MTDMTPEEQYIQELEDSLKTARKLPEVLDGPLISLSLSSFQQGKLEGEIHTLEGALKLAREIFLPNKN